MVKFEIRSKFRNILVGLNQIYHEESENRGLEIPGYILQDSESILLLEPQGYSLEPRFSDSSWSFLTDFFLFFFWMVKILFGQALKSIANILTYFFLLMFKLIEQRENNQREIRKRVYHKPWKS